MLQLMEDDEVTKMKEMVELKRVRPICEDDSATKPLWQRMCGDAVDVWTDDAWWQVSGGPMEQRLFVTAAIMLPCWAWR